MVLIDILHKMFLKMAYFCIIKVQEVVVWLMILYLYMVSQNINENMMMGLH